MIASRVTQANERGGRKPDSGCTQAGASTQESGFSGATAGYGHFGGETPECSKDRGQKLRTLHDLRHPLLKAGCDRDVLPANVPETLLLCLSQY